MSTEKIMAGEMRENIDVLFDSYFLALTDIGQSLYLTGRWDLGRADSFYGQMCL